MWLLILIILSSSFSSIFPSFHFDAELAVDGRSVEARTEKRTEVTRQLFAYIHSTTTSDREEETAVNIEFRRLLKQWEELNRLTSPRTQNALLSAYTEKVS